jgi:D-alanyl-D-alanine carboxypeptidase
MSGRFGSVGGVGSESPCSTGLPIGTIDKPVPAAAVSQPIQSVCRRTETIMSRVGRVIAVIGFLTGWAAIGQAAEVVGETVRAGFASAWALSLNAELSEVPTPRRITGRLIPDHPGDRYQDALDREVAAHGVVGASAAVIVSGHRPWAGASGTSDGSEPIAPGMLFGIASVTKTFVATVVLQLAEEGALDLEDRVEFWLEPLPNVDGTATIRQLLNHTSGVFDFAQHPGYVAAISADPTRCWTPQETISEFVLEPHAAPGAEFHYSNTGYLLLGLIIERAAGGLVSAQIRSRIVGPLDLDDTFFAVEEAIGGEVAHPWADLDLDGVPEDIAYVPRTSGESTAWTSGALYSSAADAARFLSALLQGELLGAGSLDQMLDFIPATSAAGYGLGVQEVYGFADGLSGIGHDGGTYGYTARIICLPERRVFIAVLVNQSSPDPDDDYRTIHAISRALAAEALGTRGED